MALKFQILWGKTKEQFVGAILKKENFLEKNKAFWARLKKISFSQKIAKTSLLLKVLELPSPNPKKLTKKSGTYQTIRKKS